MKGFAAGTLVHTDRGLVPIQNIRIGDMVLSRHKIDDKKLVYKRVTKTFITENQPIWTMIACGLFDKDKDVYGVEEFIFTTANHPFWKLPNQERDSIDTNMGEWVGVSDIEYGDPLVDFRGKFVDVLENRCLYKTTEPNKAFYMVKPDYDAGIFLDVNAYRNNTLDVPNYLEDESLEVTNWDENEEPIPNEYSVTMYNFEVEDYKTYFVGELGIWVHQ